MLITLLTSFSSNFAERSDFTLKHEIDSLKILVDNCPTDTCKFAILTHFYWKISSSEVPKANEIGLWAFDVIKFSSNLKARSDGYDIMGNIFETEKKYDSADVFYTKALDISKATC